MQAEAQGIVAEGGAQQRTSLGSVFGVGAGFLVLLICIAVLLGYGPRRRVASESLAEHYDVNSLPFGFVLQTEAYTLPGGEEVYVMNSPDFEPALPAEVESAIVDDKDGPRAGEEKVDWSSLQVAATGTPPAQLFLVKYPLSRAESVLKGQFRTLEWKDLSEIESKGGRSAVDGGKLEWNGYDADYVQQREYLPGLRFVDQVRVNLTLGGQCWIAYAVWPQQAAGSVAPVEKLLAALEPVL